MKILVVAANCLLAQMITAVLTRKRFNVTVAVDGLSAVDHLRAYDYDAAIIDLRLRGESGLDVMQRARRAGVATPVLVLTPETDADTRITALRAGADDCLPRQFQGDELAARLTAIVRRVNGHHRSEIQIGPLVLDLDAKEARVGEAVVGLTRKEYGLLEVLALRKGQAVTKDMIMTKLYGGRDEPDVKIVDVFVCKLRRKLSEVLGDHMIRTVWSRGYALDAGVHAVPLLERRA
jgi:two-component system cell cycle response regulator CtrA